jgi:pimeloyl-ACP methyl ester carboxylesterase
MKEINAKMESKTIASTFRGYIDAAGLRTYYEVVGTGEPLVLLHGGLFPIETLGGLTSSLAKRRRVYLPERRGHGRTPDVEGPITYELMAEDTVAFLDAVGLSAVDVVGWSDGALVGMLVAMRRPDLVRRLVMIGMHVNPDGQPAEAIEFQKHETMPDIIPQEVKDLYAAVSPDGPEHWRVVVDKMWQLWKTEPRMELAELERVAAPTLLILGEHDMTTVEHGEAMQRALPDARLVVVPGASHGLPMDEPALVSRLVFEFLGSEGRSGE